MCNGDGIDIREWYKGKVHGISLNDTGTRKYLDIMRDDGVHGRADGAWRVSINLADPNPEQAIIIVERNEPVKPHQLTVGDVLLIDTYPQTVIGVAVGTHRASEAKFAGKDIAEASIGFNELDPSDTIYRVGNIPFRCVNCGAKATVTLSSGEMVCSRHAPSHLHTCSRCGYPTADNLCGYCREVEEPEGISSHSWKPAPKFFYDKEDRTHSEKLFLGVEVETECDRNVDLTTASRVVIKESSKGMTKPWMYAKTDGSLSHGIEFVTHPATLSKHRTLPWVQFEEALKKYHCSGDGHSSCGLHIHASRGALNKEEEMKLGYFVNTHKTKMIKIAGRSSTYAKFVAGTAEDLTDNTSDRYRALNWQNEFTVEFRLFKGTSTPERLMAYMECVHSLVQYIKTVDMGILKDSRKSWKKYLEFISDRNYKSLQAHFNVVFAKPARESASEEDEE